MKRHALAALFTALASMVVAPPPAAGQCDQSVKEAHQRLLDSESQWLGQLNKALDGAQRSYDGVNRELQDYTAKAKAATTEEDRSDWLDRANWAASMRTFWMNVIKQTNTSIESVNGRIQQFK